MSAHGRSLFLVAAGILKFSKFSCAHLRPGPDATQAQHKRRHLRLCCACVASSRRQAQASPGKRSFLGPRNSWEFNAYGVQSSAIVMLPRCVLVALVFYCNFSPSLCNWVAFTMRFGCVLDALSLRPSATLGTRVATERRMRCSWAASRNVTQLSSL